MSALELERFFPGDSELAHRMRDLDWSQTDLGQPENWPENLRIAVSLCLTSRIPVVMYWGPNFTVLYNDAYISFLGETKHPRYLGQPGQECWYEIWDTIGPMLNGVYATAEATWSEDVLMFFARKLPLEEVYVRFTFGPILAADGRTVEGIFCPCTETTEQVVGARRLETLRKLGIRASDARTVGAACQEAAAVLAENPHDIPFAAIYTADETGSIAKMSASSGLSEHHLLPSSVSLTEDDGSPYPIASVFRTHRSREVSDPEVKAIVLPIPAATSGNLAGLLVVGINSRRVWDADYQTFCDLVANHIGTAIADTQAYEAERKRSEALAELDRAKTLFFSNVSHEFRTPLTLMLSPLEELSTTLDGQLHPEQREQLQLMQRNGLRLQKLVNTLLDFSRIEAGRVQASYEPTDLATYTAELASVFRSLIEQAGMSLAIDCPALPELVYVDREMWEKIVLNLISNAFKFTFTGSITVKLRMKNEEWRMENEKAPISQFSILNSQFPSSYVELTVSDTGVGIPEAELPRLFERFHRVSETRSRTYEGSGIGLALVQELVKLHGGTIRVMSQVDCGTTFTIAIPFGSAHLPADRVEATRTLASTALGASPYVAEASRWISDEAIASSEALASELAIAVSTRSNQSFMPTARILLADDNADMRDYVKRLLSQYWEVETVSDGLAALETIAERPPDLILSDVMMPRVDGFGLLRELRNDPRTREIPVILLSARVGEESRIEGLEAGADDYLTKPFSARELRARVESNLKLAQLRKAAAQQEQALRVEAQAAKDSLESVLTRIADQFLALDRGWRYTYVNDRVTEITGITRENLLGRSIWEVFPDIVSSEFYTEVHRAVVEQTPVQFEYFYPKWNRWFENRVYPSADGVSIIATEITERKQAEETLRRSEERYRTLFESIDEGFCIIEVLFDDNDRAIDYRFLEINPVFERQTGLEQAVGKTARQLVPDLEEHWVETYGRVALTGEPTRFENQSKAMNRWFDVYACRTGQPEERKVAIVFSDISDRKRIEAEHEQLLAREQAAREQAESANRIKDEFLAVLSHELRSPLNPILGWASLLQTGNLDESRKTQALAVIARNAKLQSELIEDLLDISRILRGKLSLNRSPVDLAATIRAAMETVQLAADAKAIDLRFEIVDLRLEDSETISEPIEATPQSLNLQSTIYNLQFQVLGDPARLQQVVWNLLSNAVKFTPNGGRVEVRLEQAENGEEGVREQGLGTREGSASSPYPLAPSLSYAQITVTDTGKGIAPDFLPHVFDHFRQENAAITRKFGGLGLGLAIVRHLVELHGGTVHVDSPGEGLGATFTVGLPLLPRTENRGLRTEDLALSTQHPALSTPLAGLQVLVVDDDSDTRDFVEFVLERAGARVTTAATAGEALMTVNRIQPDVLLSDIGMPDMDGYMLVQQVRALPPKQGGQTLAIALTAYAAEIDYRRAIAAGFQKHISKPVEPANLVKIIANLVGQSSETCP